MLLIRDCRMLLADGLSPSVDILVVDGRVAQIASPVEEDSATVIEGRGRIAIPGIVNAHLHSSEVLLRGSYDRLSFDAWGLYVYPYLRPGPLPGRLIYLRTALVAIESLRSGVTCVVDDVADETLSIDALTQVFAAYSDVGIRCNCSGHVMDREPVTGLPYADQVLSADVATRLESLDFPEPAQYREFAEEAIARFHRPSGLSRFVIAPVSPQWCTEEMLTTCVELADAHRLNLLMHVLETKEQALTSRRWSDGGFIGYLHRRGALRPGTTIAHGVWLDDADIDVLAETGCAVSHNPIANLRLGVGIAPVHRLRQRGVPVGLGTDGLAINDRADMFEVMRIAALVSRSISPNPEHWLGAADVLHAATSEGARCAALEHEIGTISVGASADIVLLNLAEEPVRPEGIINTTVFSGGPECVETVLVAGRVVLRDGEPEGITEADIRAELAEYREFMRDGRTRWKPPMQASDRSWRRSTLDVQPPAWNSREARCDQGCRPVHDFEYESEGETMTTWNDPMMSRRLLLRRMAALSAVPLGASLLSACGGDSSASSSTAATSTAMTPAQAQNRLAAATGSVRTLLWDGYADPKAYAPLLAPGKVTLKSAVMNADEDAITKKGTYDVSVGVDGVYPTFLQTNLDQPLDTELIPNMAGVLQSDVMFKPGTKFAAYTFDDSNRPRGVPFAWGTLSVTYNSDKVKAPPESLEEFLTPPTRASSESATTGLG